MHRAGDGSLNNQTVETFKTTVSTVTIITAGKHITALHILTTILFVTYIYGYLLLVDCPSRNQAGIIATGEIRQNIKFAAFWCVFLTKIKVDPESW